MISSLFKRKKRVAASSPPLLKVDLHSHLIPGIDDGAKTMEESLKLLGELEGLGYRKVIITPHIMADAYRNTPEIIRSGCRELASAARDAGFKVEIEAAAEYYLDDGFFDHLVQGDLLTIGDNYLLFETSYVSKPLELESMIYDIGTAGYIPLMAHPERYHYIGDPRKEYMRLRDLGVMFQVNINSLGGYYGKSAKILAEFLSRNGMIDFLGSDTHNIRHIEVLKDTLKTKEYADVFVTNTIQNDIFI